MRNGDILPVEVMVRRESWSEGIALYMRQRTVGQGEQVASPIVWQPHQIGCRAEPMAYLSIQLAQQFMDELWQCGLRPTEGTGSAGSLAATQRHLDDMRALVFKTGKP